MINILDNAFDALRDPGAESNEAYTPTVVVGTRSYDRHVEVRIADNGPGMPAEVRDKIFEPFYTTKPTGEGTGLGLSLAYDIVTKGHGATLPVESDLGHGATFVLTLPADS